MNALWVNKHESTLKRNACGGHVGVPFKYLDQHSGQNKKVFGNAQFQLHLIFILLQITLEVISVIPVS